MAKYWCRNTEIHCARYSEPTPGVLFLHSAFTAPLKSALGAECRSAPAGAGGDGEHCVAFQMENALCRHIVLLTREEMTGQQERRKKHLVRRRQH